MLYVCLSEFVFVCLIVCLFVRLFEYVFADLFDSLGVVCVFACVVVG